jgi:hypothetical protein
VPGVAERRVPRRVAGAVLRRRKPPPARRAGAALAVGLLVAPAAAADPSEVERLRAENAHLEARVRALEAENARLRASSESAATLEAHAAATVEETRSAPAGTATLATVPSRLEHAGGAASRQWLTLRATRGPGGSAPDEVELEIGTAASTGRYRDVGTVRLVVDGTALECPVTDYHAEPITVARTGSAGAARETVTARVPATTLARLATARVAHLEIGAARFVLTPSQLATVRELHHRLSGG